VEHCVGPSSPSPPWSQAYTNSDRVSFLIVVQRPFAWSVPATCACGKLSGAVVELSPPPLTASNTPGFEETSTHLRQRDRDRHGCCTPPENHNWHTRNLKCELTAPCDSEFLELRYTAATERLAIEVVPAMGGAVVCTPRFARKLASGHLSTGYLGEWLAHYAGRDVTHALLYSDECLEEVLTPLVLEKQAAGSGLQVRIVDISRARDFPAWYHNQILAMRDCWGRAVAGGAGWMISMDMDEMVLVPEGWSRAPAFASAAAVSFGSLIPCAGGEQHQCLRTARGHRKYALRTTERTGAGSLQPPAFIHGDPRELALASGSGMYVMHFSRCELGGFKARSHDGDWLTVMLKDRGWPAATIEDLQNTTKLPSCPLDHPTWTYY